MDNILLEGCGCGKNTTTSQPKQQPPVNPNGTVRI